MSSTIKKLIANNYDNIIENNFSIILFLFFPLTYIKGGIIVYTMPSFEQFYLQNYIKQV